MRVRLGAVALLGLLAIGCSCDAPSEPRDRPRAPPPSTTVAPPPSAAARTPRLSAEQRSLVQQLVRQARAAESDADHATALASFDQALAIAPLDPRVLCESGLVAHRAGRDALAAQRIDTALTLFGPPESIPPSDHVSAARCFFNRGLVDEAAGDPVAAIAHYSASITLRANDTVERRRIQASAMVAASHGRDSMGGVLADLRDEGLFVHTTDQGELERAMRVGFAGLDESALTYADPNETDVRVLAEQAGSGDDPRPVLVYHLSGPGNPVIRNDVVLALPAEGGWHLVLIVEGGNEERGGESWDNDASAATFSTLGEYLRVDVRGVDAESGEDTTDPAEGVAADYCAQGSDERRAYTTSALCRLGARPRCLVVADTHVDAHERTEWTTCYDAHGNEVAVADAGGTTQLPEVTTAITIAPDGRLRITRTPPYADDTASHDPATFDELCAAAAPPYGLTDREHAAMVADGS